MQAIRNQALATTGLLVGGGVWLGILVGGPSGSRWPTARRRSRRGAGRSAADLIGEADVEDVLQPFGDWLMVLGCGPIPPNPSELLAGLPQFVGTFRGC